MDLDIYNICAHTDGSFHELGVWTGDFIQLSESKSNGLFDSEEASCISIPLIKTTTIFQAEMIGISTAAVVVVLASAENKNIVRLTDNMSAIQSLENPEVKSKTKLECINNWRPKIKLPWSGFQVTLVFTVTSVLMNWPILQALLIP